jgi:hypothetical protein
MKRSGVLGCVTVGALVSGCSAASTARLAASGSRAVSSASAGFGMSSVPGMASRPEAGSSLASLAPSGPSALPCSAIGLRIDALLVGAHVEHTGQDALRVAAAANVGPTSQVRVYVAWVQDPTADKVGLGDNAQFRVMWVLDGTETIATTRPGELIAPPSSAGAASPGTTYRTLTLIDDQTMKLGGNFACAAASGPRSVAASPPPTARLGSCADVTVHATYPGGQAEFVAAQPARLTVLVGQSFVLTAAGTCGVEYEPDDTHLVYTPGQSPPPLFLGGDPNAVASSPPVQTDAATATLAPHPVSFTATAAGTSTLPVVVDDQISAAAFDTAINIVVTIEGKH